MKSFVHFLRVVPIAAILFASAIAGAQDNVPQNVKDAVKKADTAVAAIVAVPDDKRTFDNTIGAIDDLDDQLQVDTAMTTFMQFGSTDAKTRDESRAADEYVTNWGNALLKNEALYKAVKAYADTNPKLQGEQHRLLVFTLRDFRISCMSLPKDNRDQLQKDDDEIEKLGNEYNQNIYDDATTVAFTKTELAGVPGDAINGMQQSDGLYLFDMAEPTYDALENNAINENTRQKYWLAFKRRGGQKNVDIRQKLRVRRAEEASILVYKSWAD